MHKGNTRDRQRSAEEVATADVSRTRVLIADDDADTRWFLAEWLRNEDCDVIEVENGKQMIDALRAPARGSHGHTIPFDLILADVRMPSWNGLDALAVLRGVDWSTPVCLMTAFGAARYRQRAQELGALRVLEKPIDTEELHALLTDLLPRHAGPRE